MNKYTESDFTPCVVVNSGLTYPNIILATRRKIFCLFYKVSFSKTGVNFNNGEINFLNFTNIKLVTIIKKSTTAV